MKMEVIEHLDSVLLFFKLGVIFIRRELTFRKIFHYINNNNNRLSISIPGVSFTFRKPGRNKLLRSGLKPLHIR